MLSDLDALMHARGIDVVIVPMHESMHPSFRWLSRGAKVTRGYAVKFAGRDPMIVTYPMERGEAAASGLEVHLASEFGPPTDTPEAYAQFFANIAGDAKTIAIYGNVPIHLYAGVIAALGERAYRANGEDLFQLARKRKDPREIDAVRSVGERTEEVVDEVRRALRDWKPGLKLGDLKAIVRDGIVKRGMVEEHETILSQGRDAGIPHSRGDANAPVERSSPIVLDIFPVDRDTGYFFDMTRTFCVGDVPEELGRVHAHVLQAFESARDAMRPGTNAAVYQNAVSDYFETLGYPTTRKDPQTLEGYLHGLGHGVGLDIHEKPGRNDLIEVGDVVTIEPGLYFPGRGIGVRIEDTFVVEANGVRSLCRGSYALDPASDE
jgi:Xaa-Pro aminopeptidase